MKSLNSCTTGSSLLHIGIAGPISTESVSGFLDGDISALPVGYGGAPFLGTLLGEMLARGHRVSAYTMSSDIPLDMKHPISAQGERFTIHYCPQRKYSLRNNGWHPGRIVDLFRLERRFLEQAIRLDNPDVVHAHWAYEFALAAIASGKRHVVTCHDAPKEVLKYMPNIYRLGRYFMARKAMLRAQKLTTVSPYMRDALKSWSHKDIEVIPNPIPPMVMNRILDESRQISAAAPIIVMVANGWGRRKNAQAGLLAFVKLRAVLGDARMRLIGVDFGEGEVAQRWAQKQGISAGMEFVGRLPYEALLKDVERADVFLHCSLEESFGMVVAEAMALGVPVVGGKNSGAVPWVVGEDGVLVDVTNPNKIAAELIAVLSDQDQWRKFRLAGHQASRSRFSPSLVADAYLNLYRQQLLD